MVGSFKKLFDLVLGLLGLLKRQMGEFHPLFLLLIRVHQRTKQLVFPITPKKLNDQKTWGKKVKLEEIQKRRPCLPLLIWSSCPIQINTKFSEYEKFAPVNAFCNSFVLLPWNVKTTAFFVSNFSKKNALHHESWFATVPRKFQLLPLVYFKFLFLFQPYLLENKSCCQFTTYTYKLMA